MALFFYGLSDGVVEFGLWPTVKSLGISNIGVFGLIQAGMSLSRLAGGSIWKWSGMLESAKLPAISLVFSSLFFVLFGFVRMPILAISVWMIRIMILSAYFSTFSGYIIKRFHVRKMTATVFSINSVFVSLSKILVTMLIGAVVIKSMPIEGVIIFGGICSLISGSILFVIL